MIKRSTYLDKITKYIDLELVKVITGIRRSGKTYFMKQVIDFLLEEKSINIKNIIYIDKEDLKYDSIKTYTHLYEYIEEKSKNIKGKIYLFIDEIQDIKEWEKAIRNYVKKDNYDIYITGSNSNLLSGELSTFLTGRYIEFHIYPLDFKEFLDFRKLSRNGIGDGIGLEEDKKLILKDEFKYFMKYGGLPAIHKMEFSNEIIYSYISGVFNSILFKDVVSRYKVRNAGLLLDVFKFLSDNIGNIVSSTNISAYLKKEKINLSLDTIREYLGYFQNTFLLNKVKRFDIKGKKILDLYEKYYVGDLGFKNYLLGYKENDIGQNLENIVYLELLCRGYEVNIGKVNNLEVDFIAKKNGKIIYFQVSYLLASENTIKREFGVFEKINDNYPKIVLSMDDFFQENYNGIERYNIIDWCLNK